MMVPPFGSRTVRWLFFMIVQLYCCSGFDVRKVDLDLNVTLWIESRQDHTVPRRIGRQSRIDVLEPGRPAQNPSDGTIGEGDAV